MTDRHKVFVSFHDGDDERYKDAFVGMMEGSIIDRSVGDGDIDERNKVETILRTIREEFIADATVTVVLVGKCTWQRKYVDWEISSSLRDTENNPRCGLLGILLPTHPDYNQSRYSSNLIPPRLADNCTIGYASMYNWTNDVAHVQKWIHAAFCKRYEILPDNHRDLFGYNRSGACSKGWID